MSRKSFLTSQDTALVAVVAALKTRLEQCFLCLWNRHGACTHIQCMFKSAWKISWLDSAASVRAMVVLVVVAAAAAAAAVAVLSGVLSSQPLGAQSCLSWTSCCGLEQGEPSL